MSSGVSMAATAAMLIALSVGRAAAAAPDDLTPFIADIDRLVAAIPSASAAELGPLRDSVRPSWTLHHGSQQFDVSTVWIRVALDQGLRDPNAWPSKRDALVARLRAIRDEAASLQATPTGQDAGRSREALESVLSRKEFARNATVTLLSRLQRKLEDWFLRLWERVGGRRVSGRSVATVLAWIVAFSTLAMLAVWLVRMLVRAGDGSRLALTPPPSRRRSARAWAMQAASEADPREMVRCAYRAAVARLEEEGAWRADDARTPREHLRLLTPSHARRPVFADVMRRFEEVWFGARMPTGEDTRALLARLRELGCLPAD